tara:strand:+ start:225 stop:392 length:168 start_codon:yes stop_codon:yes gene_type:complete
MKYNVEQALSVIISGCRVAQESGAYTLEDARKIMNAIDVINESLQKDEEITEDKK